MKKYRSLFNEVGKNQTLYAVKYRDMQTATYSLLVVDTKNKAEEVENLLMILEKPPEDFDYEFDAQFIWGDINKLIVDSFEIYPREGEQPRLVKKDDYGYSTTYKILNPRNGYDIY
jgi:hypothetical protein